MDATHAGQFLMAGLPRRNFLLRSTVVAGGLALGSRSVFTSSDEGISRTAEAIHQEVLFAAKPDRIYEALMDASQFQKVQSLSAAMKGADLSSHPAVISRETGGAFSLFGGYILGRQIELAPNQRIVQAWRTGSWEPGIYSIARFELVESGGSTKLVFDHTGFPTGAAEHLAAGWKSNYWEPLTKFLG